MGVKTSVKIDGLMVASVAALLVVGVLAWQAKKAAAKIADTADALNPEKAGASLADHCHARNYAPWYCLKPSWVN